MIGGLLSNWDKIIWTTNVVTEKLNFVIKIACILLLLYIIEKL